MRNKFFWTVLLLGVIVVFYLSWLPQPRLSALWFMPNWLGKWTDAGANGNLRTAVPFLFLGGFTGLWLINKNKPFRQWVTSFALLILVATVAELGQLLLPARTCDIGDVLWAAAGTFAGLVGIWLVDLIGVLFVKITSKNIKINVPRKMNPQYGMR